MVFHSPVVHTPQEGKPITKLNLEAAIHMLNNGVDMITWGEDGRIFDFKVMIRPLKAINLIHRMMEEMLEKLN